jgi:hypothetical protein
MVAANREIANRLAGLNIAWPPVRCRHCTARMDLDEVLCPQCGQRTEEVPPADRSASRNMFQGALAIVFWGPVRMPVSPYCKHYAPS